MTSLVIDASVVLSSLFADEHNVRADAILARAQTDDVLAPGHWWFEVRNGLLMGERRRRVSFEQTAEFLLSLSELPISIALLPDENGVLDLAHRHRLTFYDAAYLELAKREGCALATFDGELVAAAKAERVPLA